MRLNETKVYDFFPLKFHSFRIKFLWLKRFKKLGVTFCAVKRAKYKMQKTKLGTKQEMKVKKEDRKQAGKKVKYFILLE